MNKKQCLQLNFECHAAQRLEDSRSQLMLGAFSLSRTYTSQSLPVLEAKI